MYMCSPPDIGSVVAGVTTPDSDTARQTLNRVKLQRVLLSRRLGMVGYIYTTATYINFRQVVI